MNESANILNQLKKREKPAVPNGFFDFFFDTLKDEIDSNSGPLGQLTKSEPPSLPLNYFSRTLDFIDDLDETYTLFEISPHKKPTVSPHLFSDFPIKIDEISGNERVVEKKSTRIIPLWIIGGISSIAAALALFFVIQSVNTGTIEQPVVKVESEESFDAYLTYLNEDEIIDYIIETDMEMESINEELNDQSYDNYSVQDIEEYYLETI